jgi:hypothetical protein
MNEIHAETLMAGAYALFLLVVAAGVELMARHSHARSERYRTAGFTYHAHLDSWECPEAQHLYRHETDHQRRLVRYRAKARFCNGCPSKSACTDSDEGREIVRAMDPWPHSEAGRFHRGVCLVLVALAGLIVGVEAIRHHEPRELAVLVGVLIGIALTAGRLIPAFRSSPANFPSSSPTLASPSRL